METCYYIYACDLNYTFYNDDANSFKQKFFKDLDLIKEKESTINKNINTINSSNGTS